MALRSRLGWDGQASDKIACMFPGLKPIASYYRTVLMLLIRSCKLKYVYNEKSLTLLIVSLKVKIFSYLNANSLTLYILPNTSYNYHDIYSLMRLSCLQTDNNVLQLPKKYI